MTFFFFQGPNSSFLICTYIHAHPHTHSLIDTLTDHTHSHVTHTHHAHTHTHTHTLKYSLPPCIITQTLHTHTHPPDTHHTHIHSHRHTQQATTDTYHTQVFEPGTEVITVNKTDRIAFPPRAYIKSKEKIEENMSLGLEDKE